MRIRLRSPEGATTISLPEDATVGALKSEIISKTGPFSLKHGFPPKPLDLTQWSDELKLADTGVKFNGEQLIADPRDIAKTLDQPPSVHANVPSSAPLPPPPTARRDPPPPSKDDPPEVAVPSQQATCILRVMPDDNSCMFRAVSSALMSDLDGTVSELRSIVATRIQMEPDYYTSAMLEKSPDAYCRWLQSPDAWGGAIELSILADHFDVEIASINVQDGQIYRFNEGKPTRCILVYSGIHYDVIALSPSEPPHTRADLPAELDVKVFSSFDDVILSAAQELCRILQKRHYYTDTAKFSIVCGDCGWKGNGETAAQKHAQTSGHYNFSEASA